MCIIWGAYKTIWIHCAARQTIYQISTIDRNTGHLLHLDFLRIVAIFLVVFNHTGTRGFLLFTVAQQSPLYGLYSFLSIADKMAVPIFLDDFRCATAQ